MQQAGYACKPCEKCASTQVKLHTPQENMFERDPSSTQVLFIRKFSESSETSGDEAFHSLRRGKRRGYSSREVLQKKLRTIDQMITTEPKRFGTVKADSSDTFCEIRKKLRQTMISALPEKSDIRRAYTQAEQKFYKPHPKPPPSRGIKSVGEDKNKKLSEIAAMKYPDSIFKVLIQAGADQRTKSKRVVEVMEEPPKLGVRFRRSLSRFGEERDRDRLIEKRKSPYDIHAQGPPKIEPEESDIVRKNIENPKVRSLVDRRERMELTTVPLVEPRKHPENLEDFRLRQRKRMRRRTLSTIKKMFPPPEIRTDSEDKGDMSGEEMTNPRCSRSSTMKSNVVSTAIKEPSKRSVTWGDEVEHRGYMSGHRRKSVEVNSVRKNRRKSSSEESSGVKSEISKPTKKFRRPCTAIPLDSAFRNDDNVSKKHSRPLRFCGSEKQVKEREDVKMDDSSNESVGDEVPTRRRSRPSDEVCKFISSDEEVQVRYKGKRQVRDESEEALATRAEMVRSQSSEEIKSRKKRLIVPSKSRDRSSARKNYEISDEEERKSRRSTKTSKNPVIRIKFYDPNQNEWRNENLIDSDEERYYTRKKSDDHNASGKSERKSEAKGNEQKVQATPKTKPQTRENDGKRKLSKSSSSVMSEGGDEEEFPKRRTSTPALKKKGPPTVTKEKKITRGISTPTMSNNQVKTEDDYTSEDVLEYSSSEELRRVLNKMRIKRLKLKIPKKFSKELHYLHCSDNEDSSTKVYFRGSGKGECSRHSRKHQGSRARMHSGKQKEVAVIKRSDLHKAFRHRKPTDSKYLALTPNNSSTYVVSSRSSKKASKPSYERYSIRDKHKYERRESSGSSLQSDDSRGENEERDGSFIIESSDLVSSDRSKGSRSGNSVHNAHRAKALKGGKVSPPVNRKQVKKDNDEPSNKPELIQEHKKSFNRLEQLGKVQNTNQLQNPEKVQNRIENLKRTSILKRPTATALERRKLIAEKWSSIERSIAERREKLLEKVREQRAMALGTLKTDVPDPSLTKGEDNREYENSQRPKTSEENNPREQKKKKTSRTPVKRREIAEHGGRNKDHSLVSPERKMKDTASSSSPERKSKSPISCTVSHDPSVSESTDNSTSPPPTAPLRRRKNTKDPNNKQEKSGESVNPKSFSRSNNSNEEPIRKKSSNKEEKSSAESIGSNDATGGSLSKSSDKGTENCEYKRVEKKRDTHKQKPTSPNTPPTSQKTHEDITPESKHSQFQGSPLQRPIVLCNYEIESKNILESVEEESYLLNDVENSNNILDSTSNKHANDIVSAGFDLKSERKLNLVKRSGTKINSSENNIHFQNNSFNYVAMNDDENVPTQKLDVGSQIAEDRDQSDFGKPSPPDLKTPTISDSSSRESRNSNFYANKGVRVVFENIPNNTLRNKSHESFLATGQRPISREHTLEQSESSTSQDRKISPNSSPRQRPPSRELQSDRGSPKVESRVAFGSSQISAVSSPRSYRGSRIPIRQTFGTPSSASSARQTSSPSSRGYSPSSALPERPPSRKPHLAQDDSANMSVRISSSQPRSRNTPSFVRSKKSNEEVPKKQPPTRMYSTLKDSPSPKRQLLKSAIHDLSLIPRPSSQDQWKRQHTASTSTHSVSSRPASPKGTVSGLSSKSGSTMRVLSKACSTMENEKKSKSQSSSRMSPGTIRILQQKPNVKRTSALSRGNVGDIRNVPFRKSHPVRPSVKRPSTADPLKRRDVFGSTATIMGRVLTNYVPPWDRVDLTPSPIRKISDKTERYTVFRGSHPNTPSRKERTDRGQSSTPHSRQTSVRSPLFASRRNLLSTDRKCNVYSTKSELREPHTIMDGRLDK